jgi:uncharacterized protein YeaC (DUF1315 family)
VRGSACRDEIPIRPMEPAPDRVKLSEMRTSSFFALVLCVAWPVSAAGQEKRSADVVLGYQSKRVRSAQPRSIEIERQVIRGRAQKPHIVFHVRKRPFRFDVGTSRYSWQAEERRRASVRPH